MTECKNRPHRVQLKAKVSNSEDQDLKQKRSHNLALFLVFVFQDHF